MTAILPSEDAGDRDRSSWTVSSNLRSRAHVFGETPTCSRKRELRVTLAPAGLVHELFDATVPVSVRQLTPQPMHFQRQPRVAFVLGSDQPVQQVEAARP